MKARMHNRPRDNITKQENVVGTKVRWLFPWGVGRGWQRGVDRGRCHLSSTGKVETEEPRQKLISVFQALTARQCQREDDWLHQRKERTKWSLSYWEYRVCDRTEQCLKDSKRGQRGRTQTVSCGHFRAFHCGTIHCNFMSALFRFCFSSWSFSSF